MVNKLFSPISKKNNAFAKFKKCLQCLEIYCADCFTYIHLRGALQRHHSILLSKDRLTISRKKKQSVNADINYKGLPYRQTNTELRGKLRGTLNTHRSEDFNNENPNEIGFPVSFLQWKNNNINKSKQIQQKRELKTATNQIKVDRMEYFNRLPNIESNSSKMISSQKILSPKYQDADKSNQEIYIQRLSRTSIVSENRSKINVPINVDHSPSDKTDLNHPDLNIEVSIYCCFVSLSYTLINSLSV